MRHLVKMALMLPGLVFLVWWGWSGYFGVGTGTVLRLLDQEDYFGLSVGNNQLGWAKRVVKNQSGNLMISEESVMNIKVGSLNQEIRPTSRSLFASDGRLISTEFLVTAAGVSASLKAVTEGMYLKCDISLGQEKKSAVLPLPKTGPVLVSGLLPWLSRQRDLVLGRVMTIELLDPLTLKFSPAQLMVTDDSPQAADIQVFKINLDMSSSTITQWVDAEGHIISERANPMNSSLYQVNKDEAQKALSAPPQESSVTIPDFVLKMLLSQGADLWSLQDKGEAP